MWGVWGVWGVWAQGDRLESRLIGTGGPHAARVDGAGLGLGGVVQLFLHLPDLVFALDRELEPQHLKRWSHAPHAIRL